MTPRSQFVIVVMGADPVAQPPSLLVECAALDRALHAIGTFLLFAPDAQVALWACGDSRPWCVLRIAGGRWVVHAPEGWVAAA